MIRSLRTILMLAAVVVLGAMATITYAQQDPVGGPPSAEKREQIRKRIETVRIWKLTEALKLDSETSAKLASLLSDYDRKRGDAMREHSEVMRELRLLAKARKPDAAKIKTLLDKLETNRHTTQELIDNERKGVQEILTLEQQARFVVFQHDFKRELRKIIAEAHSGQGSRRGQRPRPDVGGPVPEALEKPLNR